MRILLLLFLLFFSLNVSAENINSRNSETIKKEIQELKDKIKDYKPENNQQSIKSKYISDYDNELINLKEDLATLYYDLAVSEWRKIDLSTSKTESKISLKSSSPFLNVTPEVWDIIVFKPKADEAYWWAFAWRAWQHVAIFYSPTEIVQATQPWSNSEKISFSSFISSQPYSKMDNVVLVKNHLSSYEKSSIKNYMTDFQIGVPYPSYINIFTSKHSIKTFYCSSLVWVAHKGAWKMVDLDTIDPWLMVWPYEFINWRYASDVYSVTR